MKATCRVCRTPIASDLAGKNWHHLVRQPGDVHIAEPEEGTVHHGCKIPDPLCPGCTAEDVERWRREHALEGDDSGD